MANEDSSDAPAGKKDSFAALEDELTGEQRVHLYILMIAREDWATARSAGYIDQHGFIDKTALRYKKRLRVYRPGKSREKDWLLGGFNTPMTEQGLQELVEYWQSSAPLISMGYLGIFDITPDQFLAHLEKASKFRQKGGTGLPLDTLD